MKKTIILPLLALALCSVSASALTPSYKGYVEEHEGYMGFNGDNDGGLYFGVSTTHGVTLIDGLFVGGGINVSGVSYSEFNGRDYEDEWGCLVALYAEGRYSFLRKSRISPFVGARIGGGYQSMTEDGCFYFSPAAGCTFNLTSRFGLDVSLAWDLYSSPKDDDRYHYEPSNLFNGISLRLGLHF